MISTGLLLLLTLSKHASVAVANKDSVNFFRMDRESSPMTGKHFIVHGTETNFNLRLVRNASGYITHIKGIAGEMLFWMSSHYKFTYGPLQVRDIDLVAVGSMPGLLAYMLRGECDIAVAVVPTPAWITYADVSHSPLRLPAAFVVPKPDASVNVLSVVEPFQLMAWIGIIVASISVYLSLYLVDKCYAKTHLEEKITVPSANAPVKERTNNIGYYSILILLHQSGYCVNTKMGIRIVVGAWCLADFIIVNYYTSLLISYVTSPNHQPLITAIEELHHRTDIRLVTDLKKNPDILLSSAESGFFKELGDKLRAYPKSRCIKSQECIDLVKSGSHVYLSGRDALVLPAMLADFKATGKCNVELGKHEPFLFPAAWAFLKNTNYVHYANKGFMRMQEAGLIQLWNKENTPSIPQCVKSKKEDEEIVPLTIIGLTGAFVVLFFGYVAAVLALLGEGIHHCGLRKLNKINRIRF